MPKIDRRQLESLISKKLIKIGFKEEKPISTKSGTDQTRIFIKDQKRLYLDAEGLYAIHGQDHRTMRIMLKNVYDVMYWINSDPESIIACAMQLNTMTITMTEYLNQLTKTTIEPS